MGIGVGQFHQWPPVRMRILCAKPVWAQGRLALNLVVDEMKTDRSLGMRGA